MTLKVLVADDSALFRLVMTEVLSALPDVQVVGQASNGKVALQKVRELRPDLLTLDMEMPEMDGLEVLDALKGTPGMPAVIVVSALTQRGGQLTVQALHKGAFDFVTKPDTATPAQSKELLRSELAPRLKALALKKGIRQILSGEATAHGLNGAVPPAKPSLAASAGKSGDLVKRMSKLTGTAKPELILIGVSTGGPTALATLLPGLPAKLGVPVLIVQHMPPIFTRSLADSLNAKSAFRVREAADGDVLAVDTAYIAPGGHQMRIVPAPGGGKLIQITDDPPENNCRPAVDYLFRSVAKNFPIPTLGIILTGMGNDGTVGLRLLKRNGCHIIAQDEASCVVYGMPKAVVDAGIADAVLPLDGIAAAMVSVLRIGVA